MTKFNKVSSSYQPHHVAEWGVNRNFEDHLCLCQQQRVFGDSHILDEKNIKVSRNFGLLAIEQSDTAVSQTILMCQFISKYFNQLHFLNLFISCLYVAILSYSTAV